jgi:hypothetical protein
VVPEGVKAIENNTFEGCKNLVSIVLPEGLTAIRSGAFDGCSDLASIVLPEGLIAIGSGAFEGCDSLFSIVIPEEVKVIENYTFSKCFGLTTITFPKNLTEIGESAFYDCSSLDTITLPKSLTKIGGYAFGNCSALSSVEIPEGVKVIEESAFANCNNLVSIVFPESIESIGYCAFSECFNLVSIELPERVRSIEGSAFLGCSNLLSIVIPESVINIGKFAFNRCNNLTIYGKAGSYAYTYAKEYDIPFLDNSGGEGFVIEDGILVDYIGVATEVEVPEGVTSIGDKVFSGRQNLTSIKIPDSVVDIGASVFHGCINLTSITIGNSVTTIGEYAFLGCSSLTSIKIPDSVTSIGSAAFGDCSSLTNIIIPASVISIEGNIIAGSTNVGSIKVATENPKYDSRDNCNAIIETESNKILSGCKDTIIPDSITGIAYGAFMGCSSLTNITIPNSVKSIEGRAFWECSNLSGITMPNSITKLSSMTFFGCKSLADVIIPDSVISIEDGVFWSCRSLTSIKIPDSVTNIGYCAFVSCSSLLSITIPDSVTSIHETAFDECSENLVIYGRSASVAEAYAKEHGINFKQMSDVQLEKKDISACQIKLTPETYTYDGKSKTPSITVKEGRHTLAPGTDYTVAYQSNKNAGMAKAVVTGVGSYTGRITKTFSIQKAQQSISCAKVFEKAYGSKPFTLKAKRKSGDGKLSYTTADKKIISVTKGGKVAIKGTGIATVTVKAAATGNYTAKSIKITIKAVPAKQAIKSMKLLKGRKIAVSWKKDTRAAGYKIQWSSDKKFKRGVQSATIKKNKTSSKTVSKLAKGKRYYIRVRSYKPVKVNGKTQILNSAWSNAKRSGKVKG